MAPHTNFRALAHAFRLCHRSSSATRGEARRPIRARGLAMYPENATRPLDLAPLGARRDEPASGRSSTHLFRKILNRLTQDLLLELQLGVLLTQPLSPRARPARTRRLPELPARARPSPTGATSRGRPRAPARSRPPCARARHCYPFPERSGSKYRSVHTPGAGHSSGLEVALWPHLPVLPGWWPAVQGGCVSVRSRSGREGLGRMPGCRR